MLVFYKTLLDHRENRATSSIRSRTGKVNTRYVTQEGRFPRSVVPNQRYPLPVPDCAIDSPERLDHRTPTRALEGPTGNGANQNRFESTSFCGSNRNPEPHILQLQNDVWIFHNSIPLESFPIESMSPHQLEGDSEVCKGWQMRVEQIRLASIWTINKKGIP